MNRQSLLFATVLCACATPANREEDAPAIRLQQASVSGGRWDYVLVLPHQRVLCQVVWCLVGPLSIGSNAEAPHAFAEAGTMDDVARLRPDRDTNALVHAERITIPVGIAREIVDLADQREADPERRRALAQLMFDLGLLPNLWDLDLSVFGSSQESGR